MVVCIGCGAFSTELLTKKDRTLNRLLNKWHIVAFMQISNAAGFNGSICCSLHLKSPSAGSIRQALLHAGGF
jgi:hypothetical protein